MDNAIEITADGVALDLNGFTIAGPHVFGASAETGIRGNHRKHIRIHTGSVVGYIVGIRCEGASQCVTLDKLHINSTTIHPDGGGPVGGRALIVGQEKAALSIIRDVVADGQIQVTCPGLVMDTVANAVVERNLPPDVGGFPLPVNCKGEHVIQGF